MHNYWLPGCSDKQQPHCAVFSIRLCTPPLHFFCPAQRFRGEGRQTSPTGGSYRPPTLCFLLVAPEDRRSEPVFKLGKLDTPFFSLLDTLKPS